MNRREVSGLSVGKLISHMRHNARWKPCLFALHLQVHLHLSFSAYEATECEMKIFFLPANRIQRSPVAESYRDSEERT